MFANMAEDVYKLFFAYMGANIVIWGSGCSGSECPSWVMAALMEALVSLGCSASELHLCAAESDEAKRQWIHRVAAATAFIFSDIYDLTRHEAVSLRHGLVSDLPELLHAPTMLICGFSCRIVSSLNTFGEIVELKHVCIEEMSGSTGSTFYAILLALVRLYPASFILENVPGIQEHLQLITQQVAAVGYHMVWFWGNPTLCGVPQNRHRIWMVGWAKHLRPRAFAANFDRHISSLIQDREDGGNHTFDLRLLDLEECFWTFDFSLPHQDLVFDHPMMALHDFLFTSGEGLPYIERKQDILYEQYLSFVMRPSSCILI